MRFDISRLLLWNNSRFANCIKKKDPPNDKTDLIYFLSKYLIDGEIGLNSFEKNIILYVTTTMIGIAVKVKAIGIRVSNLIVYLKTYSTAIEAN